MCLLKIKIEKGKFVKISSKGDFGGGNFLDIKMNDDEKSKYSDYVVENNSSELELFSKIDQIITKII